MEGRLEQHAGAQWQLRFVRQLPHSVEKVWRALTEPSEQAGWLPARMEGERRVGAPLRFIFDEAPDHDSPGEMLTWEPPRLLEYTWEGDHLRFELRATARGCELTFLTRFDELGRAARDSAGWHICLDLLEHQLTGEAPEWRPEDRQQRLNARYTELFGPDAATLGPPEWHPESAAPDDR